MLQSIFRGGSNFWSLNNLIQRFSTIAQAHISEPRWIIRLAAMIVVAQQLWRTWRTGAHYHATNVAIKPARFLLGACLIAVTGFVSIPALAWYGVALYFWSAAN